MGNTLPKNWVETELGNILYLKNGYAFKSSEYRSKGIALLKISNISRDGTINLDGCDYISKENVKENFYVESGDILIAMSGATTGKFGIFNIPDIVLQNQRVGNLKLYSNSLFNKKFLFYLVSELKSKIEALAYGGAQPNISPSLIETIRFSLPPLAEQQRIVAKLDALFAEIEQMKTILSRVPGIIKNLRQQILTKAVTGELTKEWRKGKKTKNWNNFKASECCEKVQSGGTPKGGAFSDSGVPFLKVYNIVDNKIDFEYNPQWVSEEMHNSQIRKSIAYPDDVVMNIVGPPLNKIAILPNTYKEWNLNQAITLFRTDKSKLMNKYLYYFFCEGSSVKSLVNETRGVVGQINISLSQCRDFIIPLPSLSEQAEIIKKVEIFLLVLTSIDLKYQKVKTKIENLPSTILHQAFQGKLVPQLPTDGNAKDLLDQIIQLKNQTDKISKKAKENVR